MLGDRDRRSGPPMPRWAMSAFFGDEEFRTAAAAAAATNFPS